MPPCGGHHLPKHETRQSKSFKSCPRVGGIGRATFSGYRKYEFQVVPPCGGHLVTPGSRLQIKRVSSRAPVWGASGIIRLRSTCLVSFKSCPRVGGIPPGLSLGISCGFQVVPPCGGHPIATSIFSQVSTVSSRAPVWGASKIEGYGVEKIFMFQVVPPCGGHHDVAFDIPIQRDVSSRAPVWGASTGSITSPTPKVSFKSCPRVGGIEDSPQSFPQSCRFKSCPRVGGILMGMLLPLILNRFKSCPRVGGIGLLLFLSFLG